MTKIEPPQVNFEAIKDDILEKSELDNLLENIQKERLKDLKNLVTTPIVVSKITNQVLEKQDKLEVVDLNMFEKAIITENAIPEPSRKKKISTIEELLQDVQGVTEKKDTQTLLLSIDNKLTHLIANQQKILEKLALTSIL